MHPSYLRSPAAPKSLKKNKDRMIVGRTSVGNFDFTQTDSSPATSLLNNKEKVLLFNTKSKTIQNLRQRHHVYVLPVRWDFNHGENRDLLHIALLALKRVYPSLRAVEGHWETPGFHGTHLWFNKEADAVVFAMAHAQMEDIPTAQDKPVKFGRYYAKLASVALNEYSQG